MPETSASYLPSPLESRGAFLALTSRHREIGRQPRDGALSQGLAYGDRGRGRLDRDCARRRPLCRRGAHGSRLDRLRRSRRARHGDDGDGAVRLRAAEPQSRLDTGRVAFRDFACAQRRQGSDLVAGGVGPGRLLLVKHGRFEGTTLDAHDLVARGVVDPLFPRYLKESGAQAWLAGPADSARLAEGLRGGIFPEIVAATSNRPPAAQ